ncbi:MAG: hypothetical protein SFV18_15410 [Bryobacteraceae bacterium]|nr:hypothetical protein [Bryobacteraceae bacterium]
MPTWILIAGLCAIAACGSKPRPSEPVSARKDNTNLYRFVVPARAGAPAPRLRLADSPGIDDGGAISPDGKWFVFRSDRDGHLEIWLARKDGSVVRKLSSAAGAFAPGHPSWSADAQTVIFEGGGRYYAVSSAGGPMREVPKPEWAGLARESDAKSPRARYVADPIRKVIVRIDLETKFESDMFAPPPEFWAAPTGVRTFDVSPDETWFLLTLLEGAK